MEGRVRRAQADPGARRASVISRSHSDSELQEYLQQLGEHQTTSIGSSLKFCLVAEGQAQLYPRFGPTNVWDTAAGHAVAAAAGAHVHDWQGKPRANPSSTPASASLFIEPAAYAAGRQPAAPLPGSAPRLSPTVRGRSYPARQSQSSLPPAARPYG